MGLVAKATPERPQALCLDKGYDYPEVYELIAEFGFTATCVHGAREERLSK
jgi:hypothetical protein